MNALPALGSSIGRAVDRIVLISDWYPSEDHPVAGVFVEEQAVTLAERYAVTVIAPNLRRWRGRWTASRRVRFEKRRGVEVARIDAVPVLPRVGSFAYAAHVSGVRRAFQAVVERSGRPDLLHAHVIRYAGISALDVARAERLPVVLTEHSGPFSVHLRHAQDRRRVVESLPRFDAVVAVSPFLHDQITGVADARVDVIGNVIDTDYFSPGTGVPDAGSRGAFKVLAVALLTIEKRIDLIIDAIALCTTQGVGPIELKVIGDGPHRHALERRVLHHGLGAVVRFMGLADRRAVRHAMRSADVLVLASDAETFGVVVAEAMSCGTPVIATRAGGPEFIIEPGTGILVPTDDAAALAAALIRLMREPGIVNGAAARASIVSRFGRGAFLRELGNVYARVSNRSFPPADS